LTPAIGESSLFALPWAIIVHGLDAYGLPSIGLAIHAAAEAAAHALPPVAGAAEWIVTAAGSGVVGSLIGAALIPVVGFAFAPAWKLLKSVLRRRERIA
jgi:predicted DNA repair protein MutK